MKTETIVTGHALEHKVHKREHSIGSRNLFPGYRIDRRVLYFEKGACDLL